ncbi:ATP-dependent DNA helicase [Trichonephila clavipes]|nr:ATP-dependent DNA helicase [Trichonephila clavipes]
MTQNLMEYKREMVSLHIPFRNENAEILAEMKFVNMYNNDEDLILQRRKEFESYLDIQKTIEICRGLGRENESGDSNQQEINKTTVEQNPFEHLYNNPNADVNNDIYLATLHKLGPISNFGGLDIILIRDLRQLPPVRSTPIYKQPKQTIVGPILWQILKFYELNEVMRQANQQFSSILTKIGNGEQLDEIEITLIESHFCTVGEAEARGPQGIRLFNANNSVNEYNNKILNAYADRITSTTKDVYIGCTSKEQETFVRQKLHKMSLIDTNGLPYQTVYVKNIYYMITTNINATGGLANGAVGKLVHVETNYEGLVKTIWLEFPDLPQKGKKLRRKAAGYAAEISVSRMAVPIVLRSSNIPLNNNKTNLLSARTFRWCVHMCYNNP